MHHGQLLHNSLRMAISGPPFSGLWMNLGMTNSGEEKVNDFQCPFLISYSVMFITLSLSDTPKSGWKYWESASGEANIPRAIFGFIFKFSWFSSVAQSCLTLCNPMNCSTPGLPVHHQLPEFTQTHVHWVGDAIQPSHPLSSPSPPAPNS